jgi:hypothetical protein
MTRRQPTTTRVARVLATVIAAALLVSCGGDPVARGGARPRPSTPAITGGISPFPSGAELLPKCNYPREKPYPDWVPDDLPLPDDIYAYEHLPPAGGYKRGLFVIEVTTQEMTEIVLDEWPDAGYPIGRGDAEPGEVEALFSKAPGVGAFKANDVYCRPGYSIMYLIWAPEGGHDLSLLPTPTSSGSPLV